MQSHPAYSTKIANVHKLQFGITFAMSGRITVSTCYAGTASFEYITIHLGIILF